MQENDIEFPGTEEVGFAAVCYFKFSLQIENERIREKEMSFLTSELAYHLFQSVSYIKKTNVIKILGTKGKCVKVFLWWLSQKMMKLLG